MPTQTYEKTIIESSAVQSNSYAVFRRTPDECRVVLLQGCSPLVHLNGTEFGMLEGYKVPRLKSYSRTLTFQDKIKL